MQRLILITLLAFSTFHIAYPLTCTPELEGQFFPAPDCSNYIRCVYEAPLEMPCAPGTVWNQAELNCVTQGGQYDTCTPSDGPCPSPHEIMIRKPDCSGWYWCASDEIIGSRDCPVGTVFSNKLKVCVHEWDTQWNDCDFEDPQPEPDSCADVESDTVLPHPTQCQLYYDCDSDPTDPALVQIPHLKECYYPKLFNAQTGQCEHYTYVDCGSRAEVKYICDYVRYRCPVAHCRPCSADAPSCVGLEDGIQPHSSRPWSPFYAVCLDERTVFPESGGLHRCPYDSQGRPKIFHFELKRCEIQENIPEEHGGLQTS